MRRVCLLTGAGGLLGRAFCQLQRGRYDIVAVYRSEPPPVASQAQRYVDPLAPEAKLPDNDHPVFAIQADLLQEGACERVVELALCRFGRVDLLVNAAADVRFYGSLVESDRTEAALLAQLRLNAMVPMKLAALLAKRFWAARADNYQQRRNVVNISSTSGLYIYGGPAGGGQGGYSASKAALNYLTCHLAHDLWPLGVRVNALCPGSFPRQLPTERVVEAIVSLDEGDRTGKVIEIGVEGERLTN